VIVESPTTAIIGAATFGAVKLESLKQFGAANANGPYESLRTL
jgi:hypothetical protein